MNTQTDLEELGTDELHTLMVEAIQELPNGHPVSALWERLDEILTDGGPECLPAPWDDDSEPEHEEYDATTRRLAAEVSHLRSAGTNSVGAAIRSVHQRGHEVALPLELLELLTGGAETAVLAESGALSRDHFEVVDSALSGDCSVAEGLRCTKCGSITTQAGFDGHGWTLARLDLLADRHQCLPRVADPSIVPDATQTSTDAVSARIAAEDLIARLRDQPQNLQVWVEAPDSPEGFLPLGGQVYAVDDSAPASGDPHQFLVLGLLR